MPIHHRDLWDTRHVKSELAAHGISEGKLFFYFLAITGFDWWQFTSVRLSPPKGILNPWELAEALSGLFFTIFGLIFLFWCNGGVGGKDFLYRYFPLAFVVGWKFAVLNAVILCCIDLFSNHRTDESTGWLVVLMLALINVALFLRLGVHIRDLALQKQR